MVKIPGLYTNTTCWEFQTLDTRGTLHAISPKKSPLQGPTLQSPFYEKFNGHFRALPGMHNASNNQMLKQSCHQLLDAITRSRIFCDHLSQCAIVVSVPPRYNNVHERAMYSNTVPWPMRFVQWPHSLRQHIIC